MLKNSQAAQKGPDARRRPTAAREAYSLYVERAAEGANEADGLFQQPASTTVSLIIVHLHDHTPDTDDLGPRSTRAVDTSSRWSPARAVQDAPGAPRGVKPLGRRAGRRKASGSGGKCASRSAAKNAYAAMQSDA